MHFREIQAVRPGRTGKLLRQKGRGYRGDDFLPRLINRRRLMRSSHARSVLLVTLEALYERLAIRTR